MPFPPTPRVIYAKNPLDEVVCQVRFPSILKIDAEPPAQFQELVRETYPLYQLSSVQLPPGIPAEMIQMLAADLPFLAQKSHAFDALVGGWTLNLNRESLALTCRSYERWEEFRGQLRVALDALGKVYRPAFFTRLGLRYTDVIRRSSLGLAETPWAQLIRPELCGPLSSDPMAPDVRQFQQVCSLALPEGEGQVQIRSYLGQDSETKETVFVIDSDLFLDQQTEHSDVFPRLDALKRQSGYLFRWAITDRLHEAMQPDPIPPVQPEA